jgi:hypothetical protein
MSNFTRVDYTKYGGKLSSAYYNEATLEAWDVYTREPVAITQDPTTGVFTEWVPTPKPKETQPPQQGTRQIQLKPVISFWQIIPVGLFGLACIWLELASKSFSK